MEIIPNRLVQLRQEFLEWGVWGQGFKGRVAAGGVAVPQIYENAFHRFTCVGVQDSNVEIQWYTGLVLGHVLSECLRAWPNVRASGDLWCENASVVLQDVVIGSFGRDDDGSVGPSSERTTLIVSKPAFGVQGSCLSLATLRESGTASELMKIKSIVMAWVSCDGCSSCQQGEDRKIMHGGG